ncbi:NAD-dependent epimerase/dehydratase family protein [Mesorhizobium sp. SP-1A]|uniref:NAD-dependent epimerase/dehydratase family protein n=1 Tax=Mesorhizobium sp. SP-1A TaxID=3077840 RepID=UPI0028F6F2D9|nr:NAD-dependent epimerase/dehydratase family protein [Mesorhizobium sp. SP-1A]
MRRQGKGGAIVVIGGCGFIGSNLADRLLADGENVTVVDNLSRRGVERNLAWLRERHGRRLRADIIDVRDSHALRPILSDAKAVFHFAAQTAVTTSLADPVEDFEVNARGTLNVLEAVRAAGGDIPVIFASTNKVYGALADLETSHAEGRYWPLDGTIRSHGINETRPLDFSTPYGCSKGVADQYVLDYAKSYGLRTAVLRMSCIYGPRQFGTEDQGWVAHFLIQALAERPITIYGDGRQVRDILHVSDAVHAYRAVLADIDRLRGQAFNLGGGPSNAVSLNLVLDLIAELADRRPQVHRAEPRPGDQRYFVADTTRLRDAVGWQAQIGWRSGIEDLARWLADSAPRGLPERFVA